ncbi:MAG: M48 family metallopeptidase [Phycisphaerales bacterium]
MIQVLLILTIAAILARDPAGKPPGLMFFSSEGILFLWLVPLIVIGAVSHALLHWAASRLDRTGSWRVVSATDWTLGIARWAALLWHVFSILLLGGLDVVRRAIGDQIALDELAATLPLLALFAYLWYAAFPVERRLREAVLLRQLDSGVPIHAPPSRGRFVLLQFRHQVLIVVVPIAILLAWSEGWWRLLARWYPHGSPAQVSAAHTALQLLGVLLSLALLPPLFRLLWHTTRIGPGPLRDDLLALCRAQRVRVRDVLVWRTHGSMINGCVLGLWGPLRYVLLTDALLDSLPRDEVQAVMGHEVGHVVRWHIPWLLAAILACTGGCVLVADLLARAFNLTEPDSPVGGAGGALLSITLAVCALAGGLLLFGFISRRFEWQADAFAAQHLSGWRKSDAGSARGTVTPEAAHAMIAALHAVSRLNHVAPRRFSFRHGSIARRVANLRALIGQPLSALPIDRHVRIIKGLCAIVLAIVLAAAAYESLSFRTPPSANAPPDTHAAVNDPSPPGSTP